MPKHSREQTIHMWTFCSGLANFMDSMEGKLDFKERSLANEMVKAQPQESKRAPCLTGEDLLKHQIMELPCTSGGVEFNTSQIREKIRNKYRSDSKIAEKILEHSINDVLNKSERAASMMLGNLSKDLMVERLEIKEKI